MSDETKITDEFVTYDVLAPAWRTRKPDPTGLGRNLLLWLVFRRTYRYAPEMRTTGYERISSHWTRRSAWVKSSRLRWGAAP